MQSGTKQSKNKKQSLKIIIRNTVIITVFLIVFQVLAGTLCFFQATMGMPCPGCGMTRAYTCLFELDIKGALYYHPLFWYIPIIVFAVLYKYIRYNKQSVMWFNIFTILSLFLFVGVYIVRMILYFPHTEPLVMNPNSIVQRMILFFINLFN